MTQHSTHGMMLMVAAMLLVPGMDAIAKVLATDLSPFQVTFLRFLIQTVLLAGVLAVAVRGPGFRVPFGLLPQLAAVGGFLGTAVACFFWSLVYLPLANAIAIFFIEPLILTVMSAVFLRESVGPRRYAAIFVGLVGALIVIRPNWAAYGWAAILPLLAAVFFAAQLTVVRSMRARIRGLQLQFFSGAFAALLLGLLLLVGGAGGSTLLSWTTPPQSIWGLIIALGAISAVSHMMIIAAFGRTEASILAPFQYLEIISATLLGLLVFGDFPDALTWLGTAIILASGLYVFYRERQRASTEASAPMPASRRDRSPLEG